MSSGYQYYMGHLILYRYPKTEVMLLCMFPNRYVTALLMQLRFGIRKQISLLCFVYTYNAPIIRMQKKSNSLWHYFATNAEKFYTLTCFFFGIWKFFWAFLWQILKFIYGKTVLTTYIQIFSSESELLIIWRMLNILLYVTK